jgi:hypothetical protein
MDQHANPQRRKPPLPSAEELGLPRLVDRDGIRCLPDAPQWWEEYPPVGDGIVECIIDTEVRLKRPGAVFYHAHE